MRRKASRKSSKYCQQRTKELRQRKQLLKKKRLTKLIVQAEPQKSKWMSQSEVEEMKSDMQAMENKWLKLPMSLPKLFKGCDFPVTQIRNI
jgi:coenzyme F420-reducing hydrogenase delta subunit